MGEVWSWIRSSGAETWSARMKRMLGRFESRHGERAEAGDALMEVAGVSGVCISVLTTSTRIRIWQKEVEDGMAGDLAHYEVFIDASADVTGLGIQSFCFLRS